MTPKDTNSRLEYLFSLLDENRPDDFVLYAIAQEHLQKGHYELAIQFFEKLKDHNANYVGLYYHLAAAYHMIDQDEKAMETYETGIRIAEKIGDLHALSELKNAKTNLEYEL